MPSDVGFQVSVETTAIVGALARTAMHMGGVAIADRLRRSGSDLDTEEKLLAVLGRNCPDPAFLSLFRTMTLHSTQEAISHFMKGLVLESGAGPTVSRALAEKDSSLLGAIAQMSFLAWVHEPHALAQAFTQAIEEMSGEQKLSVGFHFGSLLGTIHACQEQTAAFNWEHYYVATESKVNVKLRSSSIIINRPRKRRKTLGRSPAPTSSKSLGARAIPYIVLQALIASLAAVQRFPEERILQITCGEGISSIIIWCYYILGISVVVLLDDKSVPFGDEPYRVTIVRCHAAEGSKAVLLEPTSEKVPVFTLTSNADKDPYLHTDLRFHARGFLKTLLGRLGVSQEEIAEIAQGLLADCLSHLQQQAINSGQAQRLAKANIASPQDGTSCAGKVTQLSSVDLIPQSDVQAAIFFLFDTDPEHSSSLSHGTLEPKTRPKWVHWKSAKWLVFAFARVSERDKCDLLPLSPNQFDLFATDDIRGYTNKFAGQVPDPVVCFELLGRMLLGTLSSKNDLFKTFLVSDRGWSIFFSSLDAEDPEDFDPGIIHIRPGVPARDGVRKTSIVDGMTDFGIESTMPVTFSHPPQEISFWPGVWSAKLMGTSIGYEGLDAFAVVQNFDWGFDVIKKTTRKWRLGFREKQLLAMDFCVLKKCSCDFKPSEEAVKTAVKNLAGSGKPYDNGKHRLRWPEGGYLNALDSVARRWCFKEGTPGCSLSPVKGRLDGLRWMSSRSLTTPTSRGGDDISAAEVAVSPALSASQSLPHLFFSEK